jgi:hypothetical protein
LQFLSLYEGAHFGEASVGDATVGDGSEFKEARENTIKTC